jgi:hypothetical protein
VKRKDRLEDIANSHQEKIELGLDSPLQSWELSLTLGTTDAGSAGLEGQRRGRRFLVSFNPR